MNRIIISSNEVLGNGPHEGSRVRDTGCRGTLVSRNIKQRRPMLVSEIRKARKLASELTSNRHDLGQIVLLSFSQNKGNRGTRRWGPGVETGSATSLWQR